PTFSSALRQRMRATPPPGTTPSSTAARVALSASSTRAFFSFISVSVAAPTLIRATPPTSLARRSCSFSRSRAAPSTSLREPFLQLLAVVVRRRFLDLGSELLRARLDLDAGAGALDDGR